MAPDRPAHAVQQHVPASASSGPTTARETQQPALAAPAPPRVATGLLSGGHYSPSRNGKLSPYSGGSLDSMPHATFLSPAYTIPISTSFLSPNGHASAIDAPSPPSTATTEVAATALNELPGHASRSATLVDVMHVSTKYGTYASSAGVVSGSFIKHDRNVVCSQAFHNMHSASIPVGHLSSSPATTGSCLVHYLTPRRSPRRTRFYTTRLQSGFRFTHSTAKQGAVTSCDRPVAKSVNDMRHRPPCSCGRKTRPPLTRVGFLAHHRDRLGPQQSAIIGRV